MSRLTTWLHERVPVDPEELRKPLRAALTGLVLAGLNRASIMALVASELKALLRGAG